MAIEVVCIRGAGDKEMDEIEDSLINTDFMAVTRGTYEIDKQWYFVRAMELEIPYLKTNTGEALQDGQIAHISSERFGFSENRVIKTISLSGSNDDVTCKVNVETYRDFV
jgi:hypothetical protein